MKVLVDKYYKSEFNTLSSMTPEKREQKRSLKSTKDDVQKCSIGLSSLRRVILVLKLFVIISCTAVTVWQCYNCLVMWSEKNTKAIMSVKSTGAEEFVEFTVCPSYEHAYSDSGLELYGLPDKDFYKDGYFYGNLSDRPMTSDVTDYADRAFRRITYNVSDILTYIRFSTPLLGKEKVYFNDTSKLDFGNTDDSFDYSNGKFAYVVTKYDNTFGRCFSIRVADFITADGLLNVELVGRMNIYVYLHHPGQFYDSDSKTKIYVNQGKMLFIDLTYELSRDTLGEEGDLQCDSKMDLEFDACVEGMINKNLTEEFGCIVTWLPVDLAVDKVCNFGDDFEKAKDVAGKYDYLSSNGMRNLCKKPCSAMVVFLGMPFPAEYNSAESYVKMYFKSTVKLTQTVLDYTATSMIGEIGGYTGLLLGVSAVNLTILFDWVVDKWKNKR